MKKYTITLTATYQSIIEIEAETEEEVDEIAYEEFSKLHGNSDNCEIEIEEA